MNNNLTFYERWQFETYGSILQPPFEPIESEERWTPGDRMEAEREMELNNPNNE